MVDAVKIRAEIRPGDEVVLTPDALSLLASLHGRFDGRRRELLAAREARQLRIDAGELPDFPVDTGRIREAEWTVTPPPDDLRDRRVEITGPVDRKMIINALSSGASCFMADFEDSTSPTWRNVLEGQIHLRDAVRGTITWTHPTSGKRYALGPKPAVLMVRPRGWHLDEGHLEVDGQPMSASIVDFALYVLHNARALIERGSGPYLYLPKLEDASEAALWDEVIGATEQALGLPRGTVRCTVLIETLPAAFQLDEILFALKDHVVGLNCGRWDYLFSTIKTLRAHPDRVFPDRDQVGMTSPAMRAYTTLVVKTCHRRGAHALGGMAAQIPLKDDPEGNARALAKVRADKEREVLAGHDGTWVAHPALVPLAKEVFDAHMPGPNQVHRERDVVVRGEDLLAIPEGTRTLEGLRHGIQVGVRYLEAWLRGVGCVPLYGLMEDAATAEICRAQVWQWIHHGVALSDGTPVTRDAFAGWMDEELASIRAEVGEAWPERRFDLAAALFRELSTSPVLVPFLTLAALPHLPEEA